MRRSRQRSSRFSPRMNIGDGKIPNKYYVSASSDFLVFKNGQGDWASEKLGFKAKSIGKGKTFNKYKDAIKYADYLSEQFPENPDMNTLNHVTVEDRLSGEVASIGIEAYKSKKGILNTVKTDVSRREDYGFTKKELEKRGLKFE